MITDERLYKKRREFLKLGAGAMIGASLISSKLKALDFVSSAKGEDLPLSSEKLATNYVNFYEFSTNKPKAVELAKNFDTTNWKIEISGEIEKPIVLTLDDIVKFPTQERIYRFRCVETWSMILPWQGFELRHLIDLAKPNSNAKFVRFTTLFDKERFPDQRALVPVLSYPYTEGLRLDEAMHPLTILATGMYGKPLSGQNGAPIRLVVPWKYGFKSIKSIVKIEFVKEQPRTTWEDYAPHEYGFYANVNPKVPHPRWSQDSERALGELFSKPTLMFNGYEKEVAHLYANMDLVKNF